MAAAAAKAASQTAVNSFRNLIAESVLAALKQDKMLADKRVSKKTASAVGDSVFAALQDTLKNSGRAAVPNFGTFKIARRAARIAINPKNPTGPKINVPAKNAITFKATKALKEALASAPVPKTRPGPGKKAE